MLSLSPSLEFGFKTVKNTLHSLLNLNDKKKERIDYILDPLQAIYTLALFSFYPVGSKISIQHNILSIQPPHYGQGAIRWLNSDCKEDIFHLFHACKRFPKFYYYLKKYRFEDTNLYDLTIYYAKRGLSKLSETYSSADKISLLYTIELYQNILENPEIIKNNKLYIPGNSGLNTNVEQNEILPENDSFTLENNEKHNSSTKKSKHKKGKVTQYENIEQPVRNETVNTTIQSESTNSELNLDTVFCNIHTIYPDEYCNLMLHILLIIHKNKQNKQIIEKTIEGLFTIYKPKYSEIKQWINNNLIF
jgi:hypothetical protein